VRAACVLVLLTRSRKFWGTRGAPRVTTVPTDLTAFSCVSHVIQTLSPWTVTTESLSAVVVFLAVTTTFVAGSRLR
jgi:hypothetical protein